MSSSQLTSGTRRLAILCVTVAVVGGIAVVALLLASADDRVVMDDLPAPCRASVEQIASMDLASPETTCDVRRQYIDQVQALPEFIQAWQESGLSLEDQALCAFTIRLAGRACGAGTGR
jgi:hypothetical protein